MKAIERSFQEFIDAMHTANDETDLHKVAVRLTHRLGFRWFAYLGLTQDASTLISSYPKSWTGRYFDLRYQHIDPVVRRARQQHDLFSWGGALPRAAGNCEQRRFFEEAQTFGIRSGITVPIRGGFGRFAAFTLATSEPSGQSEHLLAKARDIVQLAGIYFHSHASTRLGRPAVQGAKTTILTQREQQCLTWAAEGKTVADTAILLDISSRTVVFHLENVRRKLGAISMPQCIAVAMRCGLLT
jgi:LuxR family transcriptional regulator, activator of conjugal transfer of Ti plasmids